MRHVVRDRGRGLSPSLILIGRESSFVKWGVDFLWKTTAIELKSQAFTEKSAKETPEPIRRKKFETQRHGVHREMCAEISSGEEPG